MKELGRITYVNDSINFLKLNEKNNPFISQYYIATIQKSKLIFINIVDGNYLLTKENEELINIYKLKTLSNQKIWLNIKYTNFKQNEVIKILNTGV